MANTGVLFFWATGVIFETLERCIAHALAREDSAMVARMLMSDAYKKLREALALGRLSDEVFFAGVLELLQAPVDVQEFAAMVRADLKPLQGALPIAAKPHNGIARWLVVDVPQSWLTNWLERPEIRAVFDASHVIILENSNLKQLMPDVFSYLVKKSDADAEVCLLLDANLRRTVQSINSGLPAGIINSGAQMDREFVLRKMVSTQYEMHTRPV